MPFDPKLIASGDIPSQLLPPEITTRVFDQVLESSAVTRLAREIPLSMVAATEVPIGLDVPVASWINEGAPKPVDGAGVTHKTMSGKKLAVLIPLTMETVRSNPVGILDQIERDLPVALSRGFDYAAIHGRTLSGNVGPFADYLAATSQSVTLGTTSAANGGVYIDLVTGEEDVLDKGFNFNGFACDPRIIPTLKKSVDANGRPLFVPDERGTAPSIVGSGSGAIDGFPAMYNQGVSGVYRRQSNANARTVTDATTASDTSLVSATAAFDSTDVGAKVSGDGIFSGTTIVTVTNPTTVVLSHATTATAEDATVTISKAADTKLRAIGGDWTRAVWGRAMGVTISRSTDASYVDADGVWHSAFQENLVLLLAETYMGFAMADATEGSFVKYITS